MPNAMSAGRIWLCTEPTDMRCSFDGLSARVRRSLGEEPTSGQWFVFINRRRTIALSDSYPASRSAAARW